MIRMQSNTAPLRTSLLRQSPTCSRSLGERQGRASGSLRVFWCFSWL